MGGYRVRSIDEMETTHGGIVKLAAAELGIESFGMQVFDFPPAFEHFPEHDHAESDQEEVYVVLAGSADFEVDGETVPLDPGRILRVASGARRRLVPGADGVRILAIGCTPGSPYERPEAFQLATG